LDLRNAQHTRITPLSGKKPFPNQELVAGSPLCEFSTEVAEGDLKLLSAKRHNAFEGTDLEFLLKVLGRKIVILVGAGLDCLGMGTGFCGMCKDFKTLVVEDLFLPYFEDLGEECAKAATLFIGLVVREEELAAEIRAGAAGKE
jgi:isochorismate hydrolase